MTRGKAHKIHWLASYPRSGNTWMRFLLANYFSADIAESSEVGRIIPDIHEHVTVTVQEATPIVKTHFAHGRFHPLIEMSGKVIYLVRHPLDIVVSVAHYAARSSGRRHNESEIRKSILHLVDLFTETGGLPLSRPWWGFGPWDLHIESWLDNSGLDAVIVRYEDMKDDTAGSFARVCRHLGLPEAPERIARAVEKSAFESVQAMEQRELSAARLGLFHEDAVTDAKHPFVRSGTVGQWKNVITDRQAVEFQHRFEAHLARFGYRVT